MEHVSLLELLEQEKQLCRKIRSVDDTLSSTVKGDGEGFGNERILNRMIEERQAAAEKLPLVRIQIGAKLSTYEQMYAGSVRNALGILTGSAEEGDNDHA